MNEEALEARGLIRLEWARRGPLARRFPLPVHRPRHPRAQVRIDAQVGTTRLLGQQPLWSGYQQPGATRLPAVVETRAVHGRFYSSLVRHLRPEVIVEFGTAFGVSGMYWLAGLEEVQRGWLHTYEVNDAWADVAQANLTAIGSRFSLHRGLFEDLVGTTLADRAVDIAFIDGVHTSEWVLPQVETVVERMRSGGVIVLDDINFSPDMGACWDLLRQQDRFVSVARLMRRVGVLQLR